MEQDLVLALDQGTSNSKALIVNALEKVISQTRRGITQIYPRAGWVEQDAGDIWNSAIRAGRQAIRNLKAGTPSILAITNQRETTVLWDRKTLAPVAPVLVWQDRRSSKICEDLHQKGYSELIRERTGLLIDPYFSATKIMWLLSNNSKLKKRAQSGEICFGTVDSFLLARLTDGAEHCTDCSNASRTMLFDIAKLRWDEELLKLLDIPVDLLPEVKPSDHRFGETHPKFFGKKLSINAIMGDQQASLFGQAIFRPGTAKNTYGTGNFVLSVAGEKPVDDPSGRLLSTIAWGRGSKITYALEGSILSSGSALQWLSKLLKMSSDTLESREIFEGTESEDIFFVPALAGLGAPYWDPRARGLIIGITHKTSREQLAKAALESTCYQTRDVISALEEANGKKIELLRVDGGGSSNDGLMQFQADILGCNVQRPQTTETTAFGAALMAGLAVGIWKDLAELERNWKLEREFLPKMNAGSRERLYKKWKEAVARSRSWSSSRE